MSTSLRETAHVYSMYMHAMYVYRPSRSPFSALGPIRQPQLTLAWALIHGFS